MIELLLEAENALSLGLLDRAEILYRQVAGADPRNAIAVVGLARVMLERGDEANALKHARRALAIDSENTAAQRMVQRLEEVIAYREANAPSPAPSASAGSARQDAPLEPPNSPPAEPPEKPPEPPWAESPPEPPRAESPPAESPPEPPPDARPRGSRSVIDRLLRRRR